MKVCLFCIQWTGKVNDPQWTRLPAPDSYFQQPWMHQQLVFQFDTFPCNAAIMLCAIFIRML